MPHTTPKHTCRTLFGRSIIAAAGVAAFIAALPLAGAAEAQTPRRGGTLSFAISGETPGYDCHAYDTFAATHFLAPFYSTLLKFDLAKYPEVAGDLAERWTVSPDGLAYTFTLREGVRFHDGSPLTSADIKATYDRMRNPPQGVVSLRRATFADIDTIETPDARTVVFRLKAANPAMIMHFASPLNCVYSAAKLAQDPTFPAKTILGTGPFRFVEHVRGSHVQGVRNENYFRQGLPHLDGFRGVFMLQPATMVNALQGGQVMGEFRSVSPAERDRLRQAMGDRIRIEEGSWTLNLTVVFNTTKPPFDRAEVRRALNMAIDRWGGSRGLQRTTPLRHVGGVLRPGAPGAASDNELAALPGFGRDINAARAQAREILRAAGVTNLLLVNRTIAQPYTPAGIFLVDQWRQVGVTVDHRQFETSPYLAALREGNFDAAIDFTNLFMDEPSLALAKYLSRDRSPVNYSRSTDRELDGIYDRLIRTADAGERTRLLRAFEKRAFEQSYQAPLLWWHRIIATNTSLRGWQMSPSHLLGQDLAEVWLAQ